MSSYAELDERLSRLEDEVEDLKRHQRPPRRTFAGIELTDNDELVRLFNNLFRELGYDVSGPALTAEEVQQRMLDHGVRPEDRLISSGIKELRGRSMSHEALPDRCERAFEALRGRDRHCGNEPPVLVGQQGVFHLPYPYRR